MLRIARMRLNGLLADIRACRACESELPLGARPVLIADARARILVAGQAPGARVHASGVPWDDPSGQRLRAWLGLSPEVFYDPSVVAIVPTGFCYPGKGASGDLPPRPECRSLWHDSLLPLLPNLRLKIIVGRYALDHHLPEAGRGNVTSAVAAWRDYAPDRFPLPHPSPRNQSWLRRNPWFEFELLPVLRGRIEEIVAAGSGPLGA